MVAEELSGPPVTLIVHLAPLLRQHSVNPIPGHERVTSPEAGSST